MQQSTTNLGFGLGVTSSAHEEATATSGSGAEAKEYEQLTLLPPSNSSSTGVPKKPHRWSLSILSNESRTKHLGLNQRSWSGGILNFVTMVSVVACVSLYFSSKDVDHTVVTEDTEGRIEVPTSTSYSLLDPSTMMGRLSSPHINTSAEEANAKQQQIKNYINGAAIIRNIHITHHAGTSVCIQMKKFGPTPEFACIGKGKSNDTNSWPSEAEIKASHLDMTKGSGLTHWEYNDTEAWVKFWRPYFHFVSVEFRYFGDLHTTNWEYENLVSMIVMRDPLERFLAGGKCSKFHNSLPNDPTEDTQGLYWEYANSDCADNYALRVLANESNCVHGEDTSISCLESAKHLLSRFTFILDSACLNDSMVALGSALNLTITNSGFENRAHHKQHAPLKDRFGNDTLYEYVKRRFRRDIELYEWSKERSIVVCATNSSLRS